MHIESVNVVVVHSVEVSVVAVVIAFGLCN